MTDFKLPRASKKNTQTALRIVTIAKLVREQILATDKNARAYLTEKAMTSGDRLNVVDDEGRSIGTVSMSKPRVTGGWEITDPIALAKWCEKRGIHHGGKPSIEFPEWFEARANLEALVRQAGGEIPDGLADTSTEGKPSLSVRMSEEQAANLLANFQTPSQMIDAAHAFDEQEADK